MISFKVFLKHSLNSSNVMLYGRISISSSVKGPPKVVFLQLPVRCNLLFCPKFELIFKFLSPVYDYIPFNKVKNKLKKNKFPHTKNVCV